jgi:hypothetical protein
VLEGNGRTMLELMEAWAKPFVSAVPSGRLPAALYGSLYQAAGETGQAAAAYAQARVRNPEVPLWREYIATADGFDARGHRLEAWNQLMVAKYEGSNEPEVHWRLAQSLASMGFHEQAQLEERIAAALAALPAGAANKD